MARGATTRAAISGRHTPMSVTARAESVRAVAKNGMSPPPVEMEIAVVVRVAVGLVLLSAFLAKVRSPTTFQGAAAEFKVFPQRLIVPGSWVALALECLLGCALIVGIQQRACLALAGLVFSGYATLLMIASRGVGTIQCGCLGKVVKLRAGASAGLINASVAIASVTASLASPGAGLDIGMPPRSISAAVGVLLSSVLLAGTYWLVIYALSVARFVEESTRYGVAP